MGRRHRGRCRRRPVLLGARAAWWVMALAALGLNAAAAVAAGAPKAQPASQGGKPATSEQPGSNASPAEAGGEATSKPVADVEHGRKIFQTICTHCHRTDYETSPVGAPGLRDVMERHTPEWEDQWLTSPAAFAKRDETAKALVESNPYGLTMPTLPEMQDPQNRRDVIEFLKTLKGD